MKNVFRTLAVVAAIAALAPVAQAETSDATVAVKVNLTSKCRIKPSSDTGLEVDFGAYEAFQTGANTGTASGGPLTVECTRGFGAGPTSAWDGATGGGVVGGLNYTLTATAGSRQGGTGATASSIGSADTFEFTLTGTMPGGQAGAGNGGDLSVNRTLTVTF